MWAMLCLPLVAATFPRLSSQGGQVNPGICHESSAFLPVTIAHLPPRGFLSNAHKTYLHLQGFVLFGG